MFFLLVCWLFFFPPGNLEYFFCSLRNFFPTLFIIIFVN